MSCWLRPSFWLCFICCLGFMLLVSSKRQPAAPSLCLSCFSLLLCCPHLSMASCRPIAYSLLKNTMPLKPFQQLPSSLDPRLASCKEPWRACCLHQNTTQWNARAIWLIKLAVPINRHWHLFMVDIPRRKSKSSTGLPFVIPRHVVSISPPLSRTAYCANCSLATPRWTACKHGLTASTSKYSRTTPCMPWQCTPRSKQALCIGIFRMMLTKHRVQQARLSSVASTTTGPKANYLHSLHSETICLTMPYWPSEEALVSPRFIIPHPSHYKAIKTFLFLFQLYKFISCSFLIVLASIRLEGVGKPCQVDLLNKTILLF